MIQRLQKSGCNRRHLYDKPAPKHNPPELLLPPDGGTYVLWLRLPSARRIVVGGLGTVDFARGWYAYVGSAQGPGGLAARAGRHLRGSAALRWHIDFLRRAAVPQSVWCHVSHRRLEHQWAAALAAMPGASLPAPGFGASDCRCRTHLVRFARLPALQEFHHALRNIDPALALPALGPGQSSDPPPFVSDKGRKQQKSPVRKRSRDSDGTIRSPSLVVVTSRPVNGRKASKRTLTGNRRHGVKTNPTEETMTQYYDVVIVGSGTAGQTAAYDLMEGGLKVAVVESSDRPGGTCALSGCQPKKFYYEIAETVARGRHLLGKGIDAAPRGSWSQVRAQKNAFTDKIPAGAVRGLEGAGIDYLRGRARYRDPDTLTVDGRPIEARYHILATGARPMPLPFDGSQYLTTSDQFLDLEDLPERIVFVGGGFISFEFAHFAARLGPGTAPVRILEAAPRPLGPFDAEMVALLVAASSEEGIEVQSGITIEAVAQRAQGGFTVAIAGEKPQEADLVVHGAGRIPAIADLDLDAAGIDYTRRGITVDDRMCTSRPRVFAIGDCAATIQLARVADAEAQTAARNILAELKGQAPSGLDYSAVPFVLFTYPQYAMIGKTEDALRQEGIEYRKSAGSRLSWPTYRRVGLGHAAYKILVGVDQRILGAHFLSDNATGLANTIKDAMLAGLTVDQLHRQSIMTPYPSRESDLIYMLAPLMDDNG
ncbi:MAG: DUF123 domain-containing protein [Desulfobacteraceae bacterium]|nr:DUF123 domain-containing protein [Desulfobacteraceae bacterium]